MKVIWVLENIKKDKTFYLPELELLCLITSISNWKILYPETSTYLYCDPSVFSYLESMDLIKLWDNVDTSKLQEPDSIDRGPFWASSKIKIIREIEAPFILMDCDFFFSSKFFELDGIQKFDLIINKVEEDGGAYPTKSDPLLKDIIKDHSVQFRWETSHAFEVSFIYIGNDKLRKEYTRDAYDWMEKLSLKYSNDPRLNGRYMIFCEQKLLKEYTALYDMRVAALFPKFCKRMEKPTDLPSDYETLKSTGEEYTHLGAYKAKAKNDKIVFQNVKSEMLKSMLNLNNPHIKLAFLAIKKNSELY
jgi:hypothetical protein